jgi:hypothetical protein
MDTRIKENTVHINEKNWTTFERLAKANNILYDATISKLYKGYTEVEFYSTNDWNKMKTLMNKNNVFYKDRFNEALRNYIRNIINEFKF